MLKTAIDLKEAIDNVSSKLNPIGTCPLDIFSYKREEKEYQYDLEDLEDPEVIKYYKLDKLNENIINLQNSLKTKYYVKTKVEGNISIKYKSFEYNGDIDISQDKLRELYEITSDAPYGDNNTLETKIDKEVRNAKDLSSEYFTIDDSIIQKLTEVWAENLYPKTVRVEPYKINLYNKNGHFDLHKDTPNKDMVGTGLVSLSNSGGSLEIYSLDKDKYSWRPISRESVIFYTDCKHEVNQIWRNDIRATLSFKIFSSDTKDEDIIISEQVDKTILEIEKLDQKNIGFLLGHGYSLHTETFKGKDRILVSALTKMKKQFKVIPVVHKWYVFSDHYNEDEDQINSIVYPFSESHIEMILNGNITKNDEENIEFYNINFSDYIWKDERQSYVEHAGNESLPEEVNSIYLSRAVIIL